METGLKITSCGSYYIVGNKNNIPFKAIIDTAIELHAPTIRVWAGNRGSANADTKYRELIIRESQRIADIAARAGMTVSYEFHESSSMLRKEVNYESSLFF